MIQIDLPLPSPSARSRFSGYAREDEKLRNLYDRREALDNLIRSLEVYVKCKPIRSASTMDFVSAVRKCS